MRDVLCVTYHFPPAGGSGVQRVAKFVKYLPRHGWQPHVLTVRDGCYFAHDPSLAADIDPRTPVLRAWSLEPERLGPLRSLRAHKQSHRSSAIIAAALRSARRCWLPDAQIGWLPFAVHAALRGRRHAAWRCIFSSGPPFSAHLVAAVLADVLGLPWVADFRDPWADDPMALRRFAAMHRVLQRTVVRRASRLVCVTPPMVPMLAAPQKTTVIENGFDPSDFVTPTRRPRHRAKRLTFVGSLYGKLDLRPLLHAIARLPARLQANVRLVIGGQRDAQAQARLDATLRALPLAARCEWHGYLPHAEAIALMQRADVLLLPLFAGHAAAHIATGKLFEYLAVQKPILCLASPGVAADIVARCEAGLSAAPDDPQAIATALSRLLARRWPKPSADAARCVQRFGRPAQAQALAEVLDDACA